MKNLTQSGYQKAVNFINTQARPLDQARFACHFTDGGTDAVLTALAAFQNADGGFGHALEPDVRLADSSVIATTVAFQHFVEFGIPGDHPMVANTCKYLMATYDAGHANWPIIPPNVSDAPHAPWWTYRDNVMDNVINPRAEIVSYLHIYPAHFPADLRDQLTHAAVDYLLDQPDELEMHDLYCYLRLWRTEQLPSDVRERLLGKLTRIVDATVGRSRADWQAYGLTPLAVVDGPQSPFAGLFPDAIDENLDLVVESQADDGSWGPNWSWAEQWPEAWAQAQRDWSGSITLGSLLTLRAFGRLER